MAESAIARLQRLTRTTNLEIDLETGRRGKRAEGCRALLCALSGAEDATVVNNCAAAVLIAISALAAGRELLVSRGELVEIGGSFRVPEVIVQGGARLHEVGTTNRTKLRDFAEAIGPQTAGILKAHPSNFQILGFTESVSMRDLATLRDQVNAQRDEAIHLIEDLGAASFLPYAGDFDTPTPVASLRAGADLVCFSGDKLLGGPQAGIILGKATLIQQINRHPLFRALRPDKLSLALLEETLRLHFLGDPNRLPLHRMVATPLETLKARGEGLIAKLATPAAWDLSLCPSQAHHWRWLAAWGAAPQLCHRLLSQIN